MDLETISFIIGVMGIFCAIISIGYAIHCQKQNKILQETIAEENKNQINNLSISVSKINVQLGDLGTELVKFNSQETAVKFPETQQKNHFWKTIGAILIGVIIFVLIVCIYQYLTNPSNNEDLDTFEEGVRIPLETQNEK